LVLWAQPPNPKSPIPNPQSPIYTFNYKKLNKYILSIIENNNQNN